MSDLISFGAEEAAGSRGGGGGAGGGGQHHDRASARVWGGPAVGAGQHLPPALEMSRLEVFDPFNPGNGQEAVATDLSRGAAAPETSHLMDPLGACSVSKPGEAAASHALTSPAGARSGSQSANADLSDWDRLVAMRSFSTAASSSCMSQTPSLHPPPLAPVPEASKQLGTSAQAPPAAAPAATAAAAAGDFGALLQSSPRDFFADPLGAGRPPPLSAHGALNASADDDWDAFVADRQPMAAAAEHNGPGARPQHPHQQRSGIADARVASGTQPPPGALPSFDDLFGDIPGAQLAAQTPPGPFHRRSLTHPSLDAPKADGGRHSGSGCGAEGDAACQAGAPTAGGAGPSGVDHRGVYLEHEGSIQPGDSDALNPSELDSGLLMIYAIPLIKDKLVYLPVTSYEPDKKEEVSGIMGMMNSMVGRMTGTIANMWHSMRDKDPETLQHKIYKEWEKVVEDMTAEERLMRNVPKNVTKLVIFHPACFEPSDIKERLTKMTNAYCYKSVGKAGAAGLVLPAAVCMEILGVPGSGWYALYQLYKNSVSAAGGQRLKAYLGQGTEHSPVRVNYAGDPRLDVYMEHTRVSPDGTLSSEEIDDLCHEFQQKTLLHPLIELRARYIRKHVPKNKGYQMLQVGTHDDDDSGHVSGSSSSDSKLGGGSASCRANTKGRW